MPSAGEVVHRWAPGVDVLDGGRVLLGGSPLRLVRLSDAGAALAARWRREGIRPRGVGARALCDRLVDAGLVDPVADAGGGVPPDVGAVVPVRDRDAQRLARCVAALLEAGVARVVVVDDGSATPVTVPVPAGDRVEVLRLDRSLGPGGARTAGLARVRTPLVAFVDSDVDVAPGWLAPLVGLFDDPRVGLAAPRVVAADAAGDGALARYEAMASPLDLGTGRGAVGPGRRVTYVPAAALVVRAAALEAVGGFDPGMRVGEDVDLVWRLSDAGWRCRYEPASAVRHDVRGRWGELVRQRFAYGTSAAALDERHPGAVAPVVCSPWSAGVVVLAAAGHPALAAAVAAWTARRLEPRLGLGADGRSVAGRLVLRGHLGAARQLARALLRPWWPMALGAAVVSRRARRRLGVPVVASVALEVGTRWRATPAARRPTPPTAVAGWVLDEAAYSAGVWWGCLRRRRWGPLVARLASDPTSRAPA